MTRRCVAWRTMMWLAALALAAAPLRAEDTPPDPAEYPDEAAEDAEFAEYEVPRVSDPFEPVNRSVFRFNDTVYRHVLRPFARGYEKAVPRLMRRGIGSFFDNLRFPVRFVSCVFQGRVDRSAAETGKFLVNSTVGIGGFIKVSDRIPELQVPAEDVGQTIGRWGVGHGPFIVIPVLGPSSVREVAGRVGDGFLTPTSWDFLDHYDWKVRAGLQTADAVNGTPELLATYDSLRKAALDPYIAFRNGYIQYRDAAVKK